MRRAFVLICLPPAAALLLTACGDSTVSTGAFKGEQQKVAQAIADLQSEATAGEEAKICEDVLTSSIVTRLGGTKACKQAVKNQLAEVDSLEVSVQSVQLTSGADTATASVLSVHEGKKKLGTVSLAKEGGKWKISALG